MEPSLLVSSLQSITFGIVLQIVVRAITFLSNACVLRYISPDALGLMNVRLLLLESTILFMSREAFRKSTMDNVRAHNWPLVINLIWITLPLSIVISTVLGYVWLELLEAPPPHLDSQYRVGVWMMAASCILEATCEAPILVANAFLFSKLKVALNLVHIGARTLVFLPLVLWSPSNSVHAFTAAQMVGTVALVVGYYGYFHSYLKHSAPPNFPFRSLRDLMPRFDMQQWLHRPLAWLTVSLAKTMAVKQLLTEGERYVMTISGVLSLTQQGVYETVNNLGTLPARLLFRPIEENCYFYFAQQFRRGEHVSKLDKDQMEEASQLLFYAMRCSVVFGLTVMTFGFSYSRLLLFLYGGETLATSTGTVLLRAHCTAILLLAVNGITEAFGQSAMSKEQLSWYNYAMVLLSVAFLVISWALTYVLGGLGFILANCCNMATRICYSLRFMHATYAGSQWQPLRGLLPGPLIVTALATAFVLTHFSESMYYHDNKIVHLALGGVCGLACVAVFLIEEKELFEVIKQRLGFGAKSHSE